MDAVLLSLFTITAYIGATVCLYYSMLKEQPRWRAWSGYMVVAGLLLHAGILTSDWLGTSAPDVSLIKILSLCAWLMVLFMAVSRAFKQSLFDSGLVAFPLAVAIIAIGVLFPETAVPLKSSSLGTKIHIVTSIAAFAFLSIAAVYALFIALLDFFLRRHRMNAIIKSLPPLEVVENLLIHLVFVGFILLTVSLLSGLVFVENLLAQHLLHKTILSFLAWLFFGVLLLGRWRYGWRGHAAVRLTLIGTVLLLLAYFGTKLVLEILLGENWQV